jgi:hypothetical protein
MKKFLSACVIFLTAIPAFAGCVALEYQEMKDMKAEELIAEWCTVRQTVNENTSAGIGAIGSRQRPADKAASQDEFDQCIGQAKRIARVLESKGIPTKELIGRCSAGAGKHVK